MVVACIYNSSIISYLENRRYLSATQKLNRNVSIHLNRLHYHSLNPYTAHSIASTSMSFITSSCIASSSRSALRNLARPISLRTQYRKASNRSSSSPTKPSLNVGSASGGPQDPLAYCSSLVQRLDPEAWLTSYFWKGRERAWFLAWRAFNVGHRERVEELS